MPAGAAGSRRGTACRQGLPTLEPSCPHSPLPSLPTRPRRLFLQLAPPLSEDDRRVVENVSKLANFLSGGSAARTLSGRLDVRTLQELAPLLPDVATQVVPELTRRLAGRITARLLRELYV